MSGAVTTASALLKMGILAAAGEAAARTRRELDDLLSARIGRYTSQDTSLVVFGSLARGEWTSGSDLDWTYLVDGQANSDHLLIAQEIQRILKEHEGRFRPPGQTGTFGNMAFSHDMIHQIGGQYDTNRNTTQRILLLLESGAIGKDDQAYERVVLGVINRYLEEDAHHLLTRDSKNYRVPRFLLNDIVRFWRTMAVDFASKQRDRAGQGWGLRNTKLRMSRKLIFASGLAVCFSCNLDTELRSTISTGESDLRLRRLTLVRYIRDHVKLTPLEILARAMERYDVPETIATEFFSAYADFLKVLDDSNSRKALDDLRATESSTDSTFQRVTEISRAFERALDYIFFESPYFAPLTRKYGVF